MDLEKAFSLIVPPENFWLVDGKSINGKINLYSQRQYSRY